ncbi:MAG TPA: hypothetical protein VGJ87_00695 [Roseiflexaceae bacterium]|jgi:monoamine oxidase
MDTQTLENECVLIIGGGVAGPALGIALRRVGIDAVVYEAQRRERVARILAQSRRTGEQKVPTGWLGRKIRDLILPVFLRKGAQETAWMYDYPFDWEARVARGSA